MSPWDRCITRGIPGAMFPAGYNNAYRIMQVPGYVVIVYEMIHAARVIPLNKAIARWQTLKHADLTCIGHFHQRICLPNLMVNGSLIGYNSYAMSKGFTFEAPSQSLRMLEPRRWCSTDIPLWVSSLSDDDDNAL